MLADTITGFGDIITIIVREYGIAGLAFSSLLLLLLKNKRDADKRITELEKAADAQQAQETANYKEMILEYVELVKGNSAVLSKLTNCLDSMNTTLLRLEDRSKDR